MGVDLARRQFLRVSASKELPLRPPYSAQEEHFVEHCTRCHECVRVCETKVISIGSGGLPQVDFANDECTFCEKCSDVCPSSALDKLVNNAFSTTVAVNDKCLAANNVACQSCRDVCDESAITFDFFSQVIPTPTINSDACNGCGACISSCPQESIHIIKKEETCDE